MLPINRTVMVMKPTSHLEVSGLFRLLCLYLVTHATSQQRILTTPERVDPEEFLDSYSSYNVYTVNTKSFNGSTLVYVTPWNKRGYELSETFASKFDLVSPVWFQVLGSKKRYTVTGLPEVNKDWLKRLKSANSNVKIVPRFDFREWKASDFAETFGDVSKMEDCISNIHRILKHFEFDGAVIEVYPFFVGASEESLHKFVEILGQTLRSDGMITVVVIPPPVHHDDIPGRFTKKQFDRIRSHVDYFSLMTYDYSPPSVPGPNSPIEWIEKCVVHLVPSSSPKLLEKRAQILTGFNFYGLHHIPERHYGDFILGNQFVDIVNKSRTEFRWDTKFAEHYLKFKDENNQENFVFFPTVASIARRVDLAEHLGTGISIWELGQGLDSFLSLF